VVNDESVHLFVRIVARATENAGCIRLAERLTAIYDSALLDQLILQRKQNVVFVLHNRLFLLVGVS
jgi:hypothetical protein